MKTINKKGYSVIIALLMIGFLLVLSTGIFNLILNEMKDNRGMGDYIKAYAGAESSRELALLKIKENGYGYYDKLEHSVNNRSVLLSNNVLDYGRFNKNRDVFISYDIGSKVDEYEGSLSSLEYNIIPLFYIDDLGEHKVVNIDISIKSGSASNLAWNIIGKNSGISGDGTNTTSGKEKKITGLGFEYSVLNVNNFLNSSDLNYLVLVNTGNTGNIEYILKSNISGQFFTKPKTSIISSAEVGRYRQNINTELDNTEFLNMLKYSIYSN